MHMGKYPVIFLSLKDADALSYEDAADALAQIIGNEAGRFPFLLNSGKLSEIEKEQYRGFTIIRNGIYWRDREYWFHPGKCYLNCCLSIMSKR